MWGLKDTIITIAGSVLFMAAVPWIIKIFSFYFDYFAWAVKL